VSDWTVADLASKEIDSDELRRRLDQVTDRSVLIAAKSQLELSLASIKQQLIDADYGIKQHGGGRWHGSARKAQHAISARISLICARLSVLKSQALLDTRTDPHWAISFGDSQGEHLAVVPAASESEAVRRLLTQFDGQRINSVIRLAINDIPHYISIADVKVLVPRE
jgi:hypothetical protein